MGRNVQLLAVQVYSQCGARGVRGARGAVFRDIAEVIRRLTVDTPQSFVGLPKKRNSRNPRNTVTVTKSTV